MNNSKETSEKRDRIINSALQEFSQNGYKKTAIDDIVQKAEVSKGLIFHYFGSKKKLYLSLYDNCTNIMLHEINQKLDLSDTDFFNRISQIAQMKIKMMSQYPYLYKFWASSAIETDLEIKAEIDKKNLLISTNSYPEIFKGIDLSKFKESVDLKLALKIIMWVSDGISNEIIANGNFDMNQTLEAYNKTLSLLKSSLYKGGTS